jgi:colanic acid/amylovoran biosynthesis glycosyltransferase
LVLQEAQAVGLPIVSTSVGGIPEGMLDGKSGFLVPERDVDALSDRLRYLVEHPELWPEMGRCGRRLVEEKYDIKMLNSKLVRIYDALLTDNLAALEELRGSQ